MRIILSLIAASIFVSSAKAEVITTTDGRKFDLKADGTYVVVATDNTQSIRLEQQTPYFEHVAGEYGQNYVRFMPIVKNGTGKTVVGFKFRSTFTTAFGDEVFAFNGESSEKISPDGLSTNETFYFFEDNQFINDEPYDILKVFEGSGTGKVSTTVNAVVFDDGEVQKIEN